MWKGCVVISLGIVDGERARVSVCVAPVDVSVSQFDRLVDSLLTHPAVQLPGAETHHRHRHTVAQYLGR